MLNDEAREIKRAISAWLTAQVNDLSSIANSDTPFNNFKVSVRNHVLETLSNLDLDFSILATDTKSKFHLNSSTELLRFYVKGGNAFKFTVKGQQGTSDWDTQILINPWLPIPIIDHLYAEIESIVLTRFSQLSQDIGWSADHLLGKDGLENTIQQNWNGSKTPFPDSLQSLPQYSGQSIDDVYDIGLAEQQAIQKSFDHALTRLWFKNSQTLSKSKMLSRQFPGMVLSDAIKPFVIYRSGYVWKAELKAKVKERLSDEPAVDSAILMELIDITVPRRKTVEAISLWNDLDTSAISKAKIPYVMWPHFSGVTSMTALLKDPRVTDSYIFDLKLGDDVDLPFPDIYYHAAEQLTMLCEIADGSSEHVDKGPKRLQRFGEIWQDLSKKPPSFKKLVDEILVPMYGGKYDVKSTKLDSTSSATLAKTDIPAKVGLKLKTTPLNSITDPATLYVLTLMASVIARTRQNTAPSGNDPWKDRVRTWLGSLNKTLQENPDYKDVEFKSAGYSDDIPLKYFLDESGLINISELRHSGIGAMFIVRTNSKESAKVCKEILLVILKDVKTENVDYNTLEDTRISYQSTIVVFDAAGKASACITITSALDSESPFIYPFKDPNTYYANMAAMASQRRVCASRIKDYVIRTALSNQVDMISSLIAD